MHFWKFLQFYFGSLVCPLAVTDIITFSFHLHLASTHLFSFRHSFPFRPPLLLSSHFPLSLSRQSVSIFHGDKENTAVPLTGMFICPNYCGVRFSALCTLEAHVAYYCCRRPMKPPAGPVCLSPRLASPGEKMSPGKSTADEDSQEGKPDAIIHS